MIEPGKGTDPREISWLLHHRTKRNYVWNSRQSLGTLGTLPLSQSIILANGLLMVKSSNLTDLDLTEMKLTWGEPHTMRPTCQHQAFLNFFPFLREESHPGNLTQMLFFVLFFKSQGHCTTQTFEPEPQNLQVGSHFKNNSVQRCLEQSNL